MGSIDESGIAYRSNFIDCWHQTWERSDIGGVRHLWERGEEPLGSSEAAASGHGSQNI